MFKVSLQHVVLLVNQAGSEEVLPMIDGHMRNDNPDMAELKGFIELLKDCRPARLAVEVGCYAGQTLQLLHDSAKFDRIIAIDPFIDGYDPDDSHALAYPMRDVRMRFYKRIIQYDNVLHLNLTSSEACTLFDDSSIDFIYIDGDHRYDAVKADITNFLPKMRSLSIIAGHDYWPCHGPEHLQGVKKAVDELLGGPDLIYQDSSWLKYLGYRPQIRR